MIAIANGIHLSSMEWSYPDIWSIDYFLKDFKKELTKSNVDEAIKFLKQYRVDNRNNLVILTFGNCKLEIQGIDEASSTIRGLEYALSHYF